MKLRLNENSVRIRVRRSEVQRFAESGTVTECLRFPDGHTLTFGLTCADVEEPTASFTSHRVEVLLPRTAGASWARGNEVGVYGRNGEFEILVEKDFRRTSLPSPDDEDRYLNPRSHVR
jgi:hypothetical protein